MSYRGAILDLDGTVYRGDAALPGARDAVSALREAGLSVLFASNNPTKSDGAYVDRLNEMGFSVDASEVLSAGTVTTEYLLEHHAGAAVYLVGSPGLREQFVAAGVHLVDDATAADVFVASWDRDFGYGDLTAGLRALDGSDTAFLGSDPDRTVPTSDDRVVPGSGAIIGAIEAAAGREVDHILGKPSPETIAAATDALGVPAADCLLVGDRLDTDIAMGERAGMTTVLVLSGVTDRATVAASDVRPDHVLDSLADVPALLD
jgi:HAD superfamily hydrolase (TIGR01450 family)